MQLPDRLEKSHYLEAAVVLLVVAGAAAYSGMSMGESSGEPEVVLVVFDGADWKPIDRMREEDRLPHMSRMIEEGVYGDLMTPKAYSPVTWTKIGSGQQASDLNIDGWTVERGDGSRRSIKNSDVKHKRFWDYMNDYNISAGVVSYLLTWPVEEVTGFMVSGPLTTSATRNVYPEDAFNKSVVDGGNEWEIADMVLDSEKAEEVDFLALGFKRLDAYQHSLWKFLVPEKFGMERTERTEKYAEVVYAEYERMDEVLGRFGDDTNVILVSDSGFTAEGGYQATSLEQFLDGGAPIGFTYPTYEANLNPLLEEMGYAEYKPTRKVLGEEIQEIDKTRSDMQWCSIDYPYPTYLNKTTYFVRFCILDDSLDVNETIDRMEQVRYRDGRKFFTELRYDPEYNSIRGKHKIYQDGIVREEVVEAYSHQPTFHGEKYEVEVELGLQLPGGGLYNLSVGPEKTGDHPHREHGIFMAGGPDIADKGELAKGSFRSVDVTPTLLYMYGIPIPRGMEGEPLTGLFTEEFNEEREVRYTNETTLRESYISDVQRDASEDEAVKKRLRDLGYLN